MPIPQPRRPYVVGAVKIPHEQRDIAHAVIVEGDDRGFFNVIGADDDPGAESALPVGANVTYRVELTDAEVERFRAASNCRYVEPDIVQHELVGPVSTPAASSMRFMRADFPRVDQFHGRDVVVGIIDGGVSTAVRNFLGATQVARQVTSPDAPGADEVTSDHGCKVAACLIPPGGRYVDAVTTSNAGTNQVSTAAAAARWCTDQGAKVINYSAGGSTPSTAWEDAIQYMAARSVQFVASAGNDNANTLLYPAAHSTTYANVHSSIAFDENTGARSTFSNYTTTASGCTPGTGVLGFSPAGVPITWSGTSASSPHMAQLCARGMTGGRFTGPQVGAALKANTRDTGQPDAEQGGGAYSLEAALTALNAFAGLPAQSFRRNLSPNPSLETNITGYTVTGTRAGITATNFGRNNTITTPFGGFYLGVTVTGNGAATTTQDLQINLPTIAVTAGQPYTFSVHSRIAFGAGASGPSVMWAGRWVNSSGANLGDFNGANWSLMDTVWARYRHTVTAPAGATQLQLRVFGFGLTSTSPNSWRLDGFQVEQTATLGTYFDGSTAGAAWEGTANNSPSTVGAAAAAGNDYHPVAVVWPASDKWPDDGEYDFMENSRPGDNKAEAYLHYPHSASVPVQQEHAIKAGVDLSQWHYFAFEKTPDGIKGFIDGVQWFSYAGGAITGTRKNIQDMPSGHLSLQLDNFKGNSGLIPATMEVDWVKVYPVTVPGGGGGIPDPGGTPVTGTLADRWRIGFGAGLTKINLGVDFLSGQGPSGKQGQHVDYTLSQLTQATLPPELAGYCDLRPDGAVRLTAYVGGATTPNSTHSRTEPRALALDGVAKESFSVSSSTEHYVWGDIAVIRAPQGRPRICLMQVHTPDDDLCMIMWEGGKVFSTFGNTGRPGDLATGVAYGSRHELMIKLKSGRIEYYWDSMTSPKATQSYSSGSGLYFKGPGNYQQSSTATDDVGEMAVVDVYDMEIWHTGYPEPKPRH